MAGCRDLHIADAPADNASSDDVEEAPAALQPLVEADDRNSKEQEWSFHLFDDRIADTPPMPLDLCKADSPIYAMPADGDHPTKHVNMSDTYNTN